MCAWSWCVWLHSQSLEYLLCVHGAGVCGCTHSVWSVFYVCMELVCVAALRVWSVFYVCMELVCVAALTVSGVFLCVHGAGMCGCTHSIWSVFYVCMELVCVAALTVSGVSFMCAWSWYVWLHSQCLEYVCMESWSWHVRLHSQCLEDLLVAECFLLKPSWLPSWLCPVCFSSCGFLSPLPLPLPRQLFLLFLFFLLSINLARFLRSQESIFLFIEVIVLEPDGGMHTEEQL